MGEIAFVIVVVVGRVRNDINTGLVVGMVAITVIATIVIIIINGRLDQYVI
jgi:hypothetical protein